MRLLRIGLALFIAAVHLAALFAFAPIRGLPLDDAWIHQVVARTFAETGTLGYASGQHGAAATSQLWALLLAIDFRFLHLDPARWAFALNAAASLASSQLLFALLIRRAPEQQQQQQQQEEEDKEDASPRTKDASWWIASALATLLACISGNVLWFAHSGMEACLFTCLSLTAIAFATRSSLRDSRGALATTSVGGLAAGLLALTRPEAIPLGLLLVGWAAWRRRSTRHALAVGVPWMIGVALYVGFNLALTGLALPATRAGRTWLWLSSSSGLSPFSLASSFFETWGSRLSHYTFATKGFGLWIGLGLAAYGTLRLLRLRHIRHDGIKLVLGWAALHVGIYVVLLPTPGHGGRYQPLLPMLYAMSVVIGTILLMSDLARRIAQSNAKAILTGVGRHALLIGCLGALPWMFFALGAWRENSSAHVLAIEHINGTEIETGRWIDDALPKDARIASFDIGGIGFASRRPILDIGGLSDEKAASRLVDGSVWQLLEEHKATHVILPSSYEGHLGEPLEFSARLHLADNPAIDLEPIHSIETSRERWLPAVAATWNAAPRQVVYRITYTGRAGPAAPLTKDARGASRTINDRDGLVSDDDKAIASRMLGVLEAWDLRVNVHVMRHAPSLVTTLDAAAHDDASCAIFLGAWGVEARQCSELQQLQKAGGGDEGTINVEIAAALEETLRTYLRFRDYGGAIKVLPHALAQMKRRGGGEPAFYPVLAPTMGPHPGGVASSLMKRTFGWGAPLALFILFIGMWLHLLAAAAAQGPGQTGGSTGWASPMAWLRRVRRSPQPQP